MIQKFYPVILFYTKIILNRFTQYPRTIIDITGRMVETLVSQDLEPGNYKFKFNGSVHPSGLYFIKLSTKGHVEIKKAILVK